MTMGTVTKRSPSLQQEQQESKLDDEDPRDSSGVYEDSPNAEEVDVPKSYVDLLVFIMQHPGNNATQRLLLKGMPIPTTFGFPDTNGTFLSNLDEFVCQFHPLVSICWVHPLHPFSAKDRLFVYLCTIVFNAIYEITASDWEESLTQEDRTQMNGTALAYFAAKYVWTILYAVLIRQLVILPCVYESTLLEALQMQADEEDNNERVRAAVTKLVRLKIIVDHIIVCLFLAHATTLVVVIIVFGKGFYGTLQGVVASEIINYFFWYVKFFPLFVALYPIHRAAWYQGGTLLDYLLCRVSWCSYRDSPNYLDPSFPRCAKPDRLVAQLRQNRCIPQISLMRPWTVKPEKIEAYISYVQKDDAREENMSLLAREDKNALHCCIVPMSCSCCRFCFGGMSLAARKFGHCGVVGFFVAIYIATYLVTDTLLPR